jgi:hypothetical protein
MSGADGPAARVVRQHVVQTQGRAVPLEDREHIVVEPRRIPNLNGPTNVARRGGEEGVESFGVPLPARRELDQVRSQGRAETADPIKMVRQPSCGIAQLHAMRAELAELDRVFEARRCLRRPPFHRNRCRQPVKGRVDLDRIEERRVVRKPSSLR